MEAWTYSLHSRVEEPPRRYLNTPDGWQWVTAGDMGWRQAVEYSAMGRGTAFGGPRAPRFKTFLFIKIEAWNLVRIYVVKWYAYKWVNSSIARETALTGGRKGKDSIIQGSGNGWLQVKTGSNGCGRVLTGENVVVTGNNRWWRGTTGDNEWQRVTTGDDGVQVEHFYIFFYFFSPGKAGYTS